MGGIVNQPALVGMPRVERKVAASAAVSASETAAGSIELATQAETDTGTDDTRAVTPLKLLTNAKLIPYSVTHTSDTALATRAGGGTQIGATISAARIPTTGVIRLTLLEAEFDETGSAAGVDVAFAIDVGGTKVFAVSDGNDGAALDKAVAINIGVSSRLAGAGYDTDITTGSPQGALVMSFDIVAGSFPTGSRDIQIYMGDEANSTTGAATLTGTTVTCRMLVEIIDTT